MYGYELLMVGGKATRNMYSRNNNKSGIQCVCWFYSQGICHDARSYDPKKILYCFVFIRNVNAEGKVISTRMFIYLRKYRRAVLHSCTLLTEW